MTNNEKARLINEAVTMILADDFGLLLNKKQRAEFEQLVKNANEAKARLSGVAHGLNGHSLGDLFAQQAQPESTPVQPETTEVEEKSEPTTEPKADSSKKEKKSNGKKSKPRWTVLKKRELREFHATFESTNACAAALPVSRASLVNYLRKGKVPTLETQQLIAAAIEEARS